MNVIENGYFEYNESFNGLYHDIQNNPEQITAGSSKNSS